MNTLFLWRCLLSSISSSVSHFTHFIPHDRHVRGYLATFEDDERDEREVADALQSTLVHLAHSQFCPLLFRSSKVCKSHCSNTHGCIILHFRTCYFRMNELEASMDELKLDAKTRKKMRLELR